MTPVTPAKCRSSACSRSCGQGSSDLATSIVKVGNGIFVLPIKVPGGDYISLGRKEEGELITRYFQKTHLCIRLL